MHVVTTSNLRSSKESVCSLTASLSFTLAADELMMMLSSSFFIAACSSSGRQQQIVISCWLPPNIIIKKQISTAGTSYQKLRVA
jgi:hypothetical protein